MTGMAEVVWKKVGLLALALLLAAGCRQNFLPSGDYNTAVADGGEAVFGGCVTDLSGLSVSAVRVTLQRKTLTAHPVYTDMDAYTDANGNFRFPSATPFTETNSSLFVNEPGYGGVPLYFELFGASTGTDYNFVLHRLMETGGVLLLSDGLTPPPSIRVNFERGGSIERSVQTDPATGRYGANLREGLLYEIVPMTGVNFLPDPARRMVTPGEPNSTAQNFNLTRLAYGIYGKVSYNDGTPVRGRSVIATGSSGQRAGQTNQQGLYIIDGLSSGTYSVAIETTVQNPPTRTVTITDKDAMGVDFVL